MKVKDFLNKVAYVGKFKFDEETTSDVYYSKFDDSYIAHVGMEDSAKTIADLEITDQLTHGVGFSPKNNKWYGWSHRAIFGFEVGSECKKGDCAYTASTPEGLIEDRAEFFADISEECKHQKIQECQILADRSGIRILTTPIEVYVASGINGVIDAIEYNGELEVQSIFSEDFYIEKCGRGEWTAKTLSDARLMAIDFNNSVS